MENVTVEQKKAAFGIMAAVCETVREAKRIPSGHVYAALMGRMDFEAYSRMIAMLKNTGLVSEVAHELIWIGPTI